MLNMIFKHFIFSFLTFFKKGNGGKGGGERGGACNLNALS
jgi:hypothetical protein